MEEKETKKEASLFELRFWGIVGLVFAVLTTWQISTQSDCAAKVQQHQQNTQLEIKK